MVEHTKLVAESNNFILLDKYPQNWQVAESDQSEIELREQLCEFYRSLLLSFSKTETVATA
ncbi:hypothetical protein KU392_03530 [Advenella alkanexedens]|uniref:Uncharacterized protein n=1 Tax=Advenella alkanexedens TaxID=1481665 RepID=A0ABS6NL22_9BURK|nr:hypothetical protein [Advenella alkanexedens]MBV4396331.1 hypothetical protein [Advenella alkanexedens]